MRSPRFLQLCRLWILLLALLPLVGQGQFTFTTNNGVISITGYTGTNGVVVVPSTTNGYPVVSIGDNAFFSQSFITSITIPGSITNIGFAAFNSCTALTNITIPNSVTSIGNLAFAFCSSLTNITVSPGNPAYSSVEGVLFDSLQGTLVEFPAGFSGDYAIPNSVGNIGAFAFYSCAGLTNVTLPGGVASIAERAFDHCYALTNITVSSNNAKLSSVGGVLFDVSRGTLIQFPGGSGGSYVVPNSVTNMGNYAFDTCANLTGLTIPNSVTSIGSGVCFGCSGLTRITIPGSLSSISDSAFANCTGLTNIVLPNSVTNIGDYAFISCYALSRVTLPNSVVRIGGYAFSGTGLTSITIPNSVNSIGSLAYAYCINLTNVVIGSGVTNIGSIVFQACNKLRTLSLGCPSIGSWFAGLPINSVTILDSVTNIGVNAFASLSSLTHVVIGGGVTSIGSNAFYNCSGLQSILFTGNAPSVGPSAFSGVYATVYYLPGTTGWGTPFGGLTAYLWNPKPQTDDASFGVRTNRFGFNITGTSDLIIVVEASTNLVNWQSVQTKVLIGGKAYFNDPAWTNYPIRLYRLRPP